MDTVPEIDPACTKFVISAAHDPTKGKDLARSAVPCAQPSLQHRRNPVMTRSTAVYFLAPVPQ